MKKEKNKVSYLVCPNCHCIIIQDIVEMPDGYLCPHCLMSFGKEKKATEVK